MARQRPGEARHEVDHLVVTCMDHRFHDWYGDILTEEEVHRADKLCMPGASKALNEGQLSDAILISHRLHKIKNIWIFDHTDCGAFGGLEAYDFDQAVEAQAHFRSLDKAERLLNSMLPRLAVRTSVIGLDGKEIKRGENPNVGPSHPQPDHPPDSI